MAMASVNKASFLTSRLYCETTSCTVPSTKTCSISGSQSAVHHFWDDPPTDLWHFGTILIFHYLVVAGFLHRWGPAGHTTLITFFVFVSSYRSLLSGHSPFLCMGWSGPHPTCSPQFLLPFSSPLLVFVPLDCCLVLGLRSKSSGSIESPEWIFSLACCDSL